MSVDQFFRRKRVVCDGGIFLSLMLLAVLSLSGSSGAIAQTMGREAAVQSSRPDAEKPVSRGQYKRIRVGKTDGLTRSVPQGEQSVHVTLDGGGVSKTLKLPKNKSAIIELPVDASEVVVSNSQILDIVSSTPRHMYLLGLTAGDADASFRDAAGRLILRLEVHVEQNTASLAATLHKILPNSQIAVEALNNNLILSGQVPDASSAQKAMDLAKSFVSATDNVVNMLTIAGRDQVLLKVQIIEVSRSVIKQLGFDLNTLIGQSGRNQYSFGISPLYGVSGALLGGLNAGYKIDTTQEPVDTVVCAPADQNCAAGATFVSHSNHDVAAVTTTAGQTGVNKGNANIQAFESAGLIRTLAEPELMTVSGESAKFLAGGEFPVPVAGGVNGQVDVIFKEYGVGLAFSPVVLNSGRISLKVSTEISEISSLNSFTSSVAGGSGSYVIPGLTKRSVETTAELPSGGAIMLAGLLKNTTQQTLNSLPGLMNLPVLGALFRSRDFLDNQNELAVIITPYIVKPTSPDRLASPADGLVIPNDIETDLLGRLNTNFSKPSSGPAQSTYQGPFGYVVD